MGGIRLCFFMVMCKENKKNALIKNEKVVGWNFEDRRRGRGRGRVKMRSKE